MKKKIMNLTKGDIFEAPNGTVEVCVDNTAKSGLIFATTIDNFISVEINNEGIYGYTNSGWEEFDPSAIVDVKGSLI